MQGLEEESYLDGLQGGHDHLQRPSLESLGAASVLSQRSQGGGHTHVLETHGSGGSAVTSPLLTRLATRRKHVRMQASHQRHHTIPVQAGFP